MPPEGSPSAESGTLSKDTIADGLLAGDRNVTGLSKAERYRLRVATEALMARGHPLNTILEMMGTTRGFYFNQVDTIKTPPQEALPSEKQAAPKAPHKPRLTYEEQIKVLERVDHLRYVQGLQMYEACKSAGVTMHRYYRILQRRAAILRAIQYGHGKDTDDPKPRRRMRIPDKTSHEERADWVRIIRRRIDRGTKLVDLLERERIPLRIYMKWAREVDAEALKVDDAPENEEGILTYWKRFKLDTHDEEARHRLEEHYLPLVRTIAEHVSAGLPRFVDIRDLIQAGYLGLRDAIFWFDPQRGKSFVRSYAPPRIWGAIMDYLRSIDWAPRAVRSRKRQEDANGRPHPETSGGEEQAVATEEPVVIPSMRSLSSPAPEHAPHGEDKERFLVDMLRDERAEDPSAEMERGDVLRGLLRGCSTAERIVLIGYYYQERTMKEIGGDLDCTESRVSQMHSTVVARKQDDLEFCQEDFV